MTSKRFSVPPKAPLFPKGTQVFSQFDLQEGRKTYARDVWMSGIVEVAPNRACGSYVVTFEDGKDNFRISEKELYSSFPEQSVQHVRWDFGDLTAYPKVQVSPKGPSGDDQLLQEDDELSQPIIDLSDIRTTTRPTHISPPASPIRSPRQSPSISPPASPIRHALTGARISWLDSPPLSPLSQSPILPPRQQQSPPIQPIPIPIQPIPIPIPIHIQPINTQPVIAQPINNPSPRSFPSLTELTELPKFRLFQFVPWKARSAWNEACDVMWERVAAHNNNYYWTLYYMMPYCILVSPGRGKGKGSAAKQIISNTKRWKDGEHLELWKDAKTILTKPVKARSKPANPYSTAVKLVAQQRLSHASQRLTTDGVAHASQETFDLLLSKHPAGPQHPTPENLPAPPEFNIKQILSATFSFPKGSSPGAFGWYPDIIKATLSKESSAPQNVSFARLINRVASGSVPEAIRPFLAGAHLTPLIKSQHDIRPIASGDPLRRIASKCYNRHIMEEARSMLEPIQHGCSESGTEKIIHHLRSVIDTLPSTDQQVVLKIDLRNAFNSVSRDVILDRTVALFPSMARYIYFCYGRHSSLFYNSNIVKSMTGVQQGDPLSTLLFCIAIQPVLDELTVRFTGIHQAWFCDDGTFLTDVTTAAEICYFLNEQFASIGLDLNLAKSEVIPLDPTITSIERLTNGKEELDILDATTFIQGPNFSTLGAPIGSPAYCAEFVSAKLRNIRHLLDQISKLDHVQVSLLLLRFTGSFGKIAYYARTIPTASIIDQCSEFDEQMICTLGEILGQHLDDEAIDRASLPLKKGGLGLRLAERHARAAYISSFSQCSLQLRYQLDDTHLNQCVDEFNTYVSANQQIRSNHLADNSVQKDLSWKLDIETLQRLLDQLEPEHRAKLLGCTADFAHYWLTVMPDKFRNHEFTNAQMATLIKFWLNMDTFPEDTRCPLTACNDLLDPKGVHALTCKAAGDRIRKHNSIVDFIYQQAISAAKNPTKEKLHLLGQDNSMKPADIFLPNFKNGKSLCIDIGIVTPMAPSHVNAASKDALAAAEKYSEVKTKKYAHVCEERGIFYLPAVGEVMGGWSDQANGIFQHLIKAISHRFRVKFGIQKRIFYEDLSVRLQRANATAFLQRDYFSIDFV